MDKLDYIIVLLERIAFHAAHNAKYDIEDFLHEVVIKHAPTRRYTLSSDKEGWKEDSVGVRQRNQSGNRSKKPRKRRNAHPGGVPEGPA